MKTSEASISLDQRLFQKQILEKNNLRGTNVRIPAEVDVLCVDNIDSVTPCTQNPMQRGTPDAPHEINNDA